MLCRICIFKEQILRVCETIIALCHPHVPPFLQRVCCCRCIKKLNGDSNAGEKPFSAVSRTAWHLLMDFFLSVCFSDKASLPHSREPVLAFSQSPGTGGALEKPRRHITFGPPGSACSAMVASSIKGCLVWNFLTSSDWSQLGLPGPPDTKDA